MGTEVRPVRFQTVLLEELEVRLAREGGDLSAFVNAALDRALHGDEPRLTLVPEPVAPGELASAAVAYQAALLERDGARARALVEDLVERGARVIDVYASVLAPALHEIGELWSLEQVSVADEHYATEETAQLLTALAPERRVAPSRGRLAVVGGTPDELHALGARMVGDLLERGGWEVIALGASTPADDLAALVAAECPDLVALSTATVGRLPGAEEALGLLHRARPRPVLAVGGGLYRGPVADLARAWGADVVTSDLAEFLETLRQRFPPAA
ncbi:MAG TPA: cobalamin-dependent protein [Baekduia sp.]